MGKIFHNRDRVFDDGVIGLKIFDQHQMGLKISIEGIDVKGRERKGNAFDLGEKIVTDLFKPVGKFGDVVIVDGGVGLKHPDTLLLFDKVKLIDEADKRLGLVIALLPCHPAVSG